MVMTQSGSVMEIANVTARAGSDDELAEAYREAVAVVMEHPGARRATVFRQREDPRQFSLLIEWSSVEAHLDFGASPLLERFRAAVGGRVEAGSAGHYDEIVEV